MKHFKTMRISENNIYALLAKKKKTQAIINTLLTPDSKPISFENNKYL